MICADMGELLRIMLGATVTFNFIGAEGFYNALAYLGSCALSGALDTTQYRVPAPVQEINLPGERTSAYARSQQFQLSPSMSQDANVPSAARSVGDYSSQSHQRKDFLTTVNIQKKRQSPRPKPTSQRSRPSIISAGDDQQQITGQAEKDSPLAQSPLDPDPDQLISELDSGQTSATLVVESGFQRSMDGTALNDDLDAGNIDKDGDIDGQRKRTRSA